jgi:hypothetical protein
MKQNFLSGIGFFKDRSDPVLRGRLRLPFRYDALGYAFVPAFILFLVALFAISFDLWGFFNIPVVEGYLFLDLQQITYSAECYRQLGWSIQDGTTCDPLLRPYNYPMIWVIIVGGLFGLGSQQTFYLGAVLLVFTVWAIGMLTYIAVAGGSVETKKNKNNTRSLSFLSLARKRNFFIVAAMSFAAVSPPVLFLIERGNIDQFAFFTVVFATLLFLVARGTIGRIITGLLFSFAAWLKLFPLLSILVVFADSWRRKVLLGAWLIGLAVAGIYLFQEISYINSGTPQGAAVSFGSTVLFRTMVYPELNVPGYSEMQLRLAGLTVILLFVGILYFVLNKTSFRIVWISFLYGLLHDKFSKALILLGAGIFVSAFLLGSSVDYRLVFVLPLVAGFARLTSKMNPFSGILTIFLLFQLWSTKFEGDPRASLSVVSDVLWIVFVAFLILVLYAIVREGVMESSLYTKKGNKKMTEKTLEDSKVSDSSAADKNLEAQSPYPASDECMKTVSSIESFKQKDTREKND